MVELFGSQERDNSKSFAAPAAVAGAAPASLQLAKKKDSLASSTGARHSQPHHKHRFIIYGNASARTGNLLGKIQTPAFTLCTSRGLPPYLSDDVV